MSDVNIRIRDEEELPENNKEQMKMVSSTTYGDTQRQEDFFDIEMQKRRWKNRRRMAWISLGSMIGVTLILLFVPIPDGRLKILAEAITWFYLAATSIIGAYMGFTTWASRK